MVSNVTRLPVQGRLLEELPYMVVWLDKYYGDTQMLTDTEQHGAYLLLMMAMWKNHGSLPLKPKVLAHICKSTVPHFEKAIWPAIHHLFVKVELEEGDVIQSLRLSDQLQKSRYLRSQKSAAARAKWLKSK